MLKLKDLSLFYAAYFSSDRLLFEQSERLTSNESKLSEAIQDFQPYSMRKLRLDDIKSLIIQQSLDTERSSVKEMLISMVNKFIHWNGQCFVVKPEYLDEWLELSTIIDTSWVIAMGYVELITKQGFKENEIISCVTMYQCPYALSSNRKTVDYADNHIHLGGHGYLGPSLLNFCLYGDSIDKQFNWPRRPEYTLFESEYLEKSALPKYCSHFADELAIGILNNNYTSILFEKEKNKKFEEKTLLKMQAENPLVFCVSPEQKLLFNAFNVRAPSSKRWLIYLTSIILSDQIAEKTKLTFIRLCNILRNYMVVSGVGLSSFIKTSSFEARNYRGSEQEQSRKDDKLFSDICLNTYREFRVIPSFVLGSKKKTKVNYFKNTLKKLFINCLYENSHFVVHFSRKGDRSDKLQQEKRLELIESVRSFQDFSSSVEFSSQEIQKNTLPKEVVELDLRRAVRGFDVAGNENELPIEVFAPALRALKNNKVPTTSEKFIRQPNPFLTVHAGEDFSHILSGMRSIDETVTFCDFNDGDRLGHALALGVDPSTWAQRQHTAYITVGEHLDNLVWVYQKAIKVIERVPKLLGVLPILSEKIHYWSEFLYGESQPPKRLYDAWLLRRNCPITIGLSANDAKINYSLTSLYNDFVPDLEPFNLTHGNEKHIRLWHKYLLSDINSSYINKSKKIVSVFCCAQDINDDYGLSGRFTDSISKSELQLYEAIQDHLMESYSKKGIVIEVCPTSNIYLGRFESYSEHPVYRWSPPDPSWLGFGEQHNKFGLRRGPISVCVNTDDAAIMPTNIENEHRVLKKTAVDSLDVSANSAEVWVGRLRKKGLELFNYNHLNWVHPYNSN